MLRTATYVGSQGGRDLYEKDSGDETYVDREETWNGDEIWRNIGKEYGQGAGCACHEWLIRRATAPREIEECKILTRLENQTSQRNMAPRSSTCPKWDPGLFLIQSKFP